MKKYLTILIVALTLSAFSKRPDFEQIKGDFTSNTETFENLRTMIIQDAKPRNYFNVSHRHIGRYFERDGKWRHFKNHKKNLKLEEVLKEVGLTQERYNRYLTEFKMIGAVRVVHYEGWTRIFIERDGMSVSGSSTTIDIKENGDMPQSDIRDSFQIEIIPLSEGWFINYQRT